MSTRPRGAEDVSRFHRKPNLRNRTAPEIEQAILELTIQAPDRVNCASNNEHWGKRGLTFSPQAERAASIRRLRRPEPERRGPRSGEAQGVAGKTSASRFLITSSSRPWRPPFLRMNGAADPRGDS